MSREIDTATACQDAAVGDGYVVSELASALARLRAHLALLVAEEYVERILAAADDDHGEGGES